MPTPNPGGLSSDITGALLKALFHELNKLYFERTLACEVLWGPKSMIRCAGLTSVKGDRTIIRLSPVLLRPVTMNLLNILLHEMIHAHLLNTDPNSCVLNGGHGTAFREKAREIMEAEVDDSRVWAMLRRPKERYLIQQYHTEGWKYVNSMAHCYQCKCGWTVWRGTACKPIEEHCVCYRDPDDRKKLLSCKNRGEDGWHCSKLRMFPPQDCPWHDHASKHTRQDPPAWTKVAEPANYSPGKARITTDDCGPPVPPPQNARDKEIVFLLPPRPSQAPERASASIEEAVERRGLSLISPAISFDTTIVLVSEPGLTPLELLKAILALEAGAYHHNGQMSLVYLRNRLAIERLCIVNTGLLNSASPLSREDDAYMYFPLSEREKHWAWPWEEVNVTPLKPGAMHLIILSTGQRKRKRSPRRAKRPRISRVALEEDLPSV